MKRLNWYISLLLLSLALSACNTAAGTGAITQPVNGTQNAAVEGALSTEMQLAIGTLLLDESEQPLSAETAAELLPLWKAVRSLGSSSTITTQEYQALFKQIQETMPAEQMNAITAMQLSRDDLMTLSEKLGISMMGSGGGLMGTPSPEMLETLQAARESGEMPEMPSGGGMPPGGMPAGGGGGMGGGFAGGGGMPGGGGIDPSAGGGMAMPTQDASTGTRTRGGVMQSVPTELLDAVIEYLQARVEG